jgi:hypothetical protein
MTTVVLILAAIGLAGFVAKVVILVRTRHEQTVYNLRFQKVARPVCTTQGPCVSGCGEVCECAPSFLEPGRGWVHK